MYSPDHYPVPSEVQPFFGQILDADGHENIPLNHWIAEFGSVVKPLADAMALSGLEVSQCRDKDDVEIDADTVFKKKFSEAPGCFDMGRRLDVLDYVGTKRQFLYPGGVGLFATTIYCFPEKVERFATITGDRRAYARKVIDAHNGWCIRVARTDSRLRPVAIMIGQTAEGLVADARKLIDAGIRGLWFPSSTPIAGLSPASTLLDPLWSLMQSAGVPLLTHVGSDEGFLRSEIWREASAFEGWKSGGEFQLDPWTLSSLHLATQNFLTCLILGGVFERFPRLIYGAAEVTAQWVGPLGQNMDLWHANNRKFRQIGGASPLSMRPSDYIRRNVRVSPFDVEDVATYIDQFGLEDIYCYTADFPHAEGGKRPIEDFSDNLKRLGPVVMRKFFVENAELLLPA
jgi:predicted TIM-barrel fold metal-dependent hydrolase